MTQEPQKSSHVVLIVIAIIGVIGSVIGATITVMGNYNVEKMRQELELTRIALVITATQNARAQASPLITTPPPTITPSPTYTFTPTVVVPVTEDPAITMCNWLKDNFPQTQQEVIARFGFPQDTTIKFNPPELCPTIANSFSFKATTVIQLDVPSGGCIDSWAGFTEYVGDVGTPVPDGWGGWRVYKGTVRAPEMTYRIKGCK